MQGSYNTLKSRVGRRVLILLCLMALLPVVFIGSISVIQLHNHLHNNTNTNLKQSGVHIRNLLQQKFQLLHHELGFLSQEQQQSKQTLSKTQRQRADQYFDAVSIISENFKDQGIFGNINIAPIIKHIKHVAIFDNRPSIFTQHTIPNRVEIYMIQRRAGSKGWIVARINSRFLKTIKQNTSPQQEITITDQQFDPIYTQSKLSILPTSLEQLIHNKNPDTETTTFKKHTVWAGKIDFSSDFNTPPWHILLSKPQSAIMTSTLDHILLLGLLSLIILGLVLYVGIRHINHILNPLNRFRAAITNVMSNRFNNQIEIDTNDEFSDLAKAFNRMSEQVGRQVNALEALSHIDKVILSASDIQQILDISLLKMPKVLGCENIAILMMRDQNPAKSTLYFRGDFLSTEINTMSTTLSADDIDQLDNNQQVTIKPKLTGYREFLTPMKREHEEFLLIPIKIDDKLSGALILCYKSAVHYSANDLIVAKDLAQRIAVALSNAAWEEKLYQKAHFDTLTELPNRLLFQDRLNQAITRSKRENTLMALLFIDLDRFKYINDSLGHDLGDVFLQETARRLSTCVRNIDTVSRLGGDEFTVIIPDLKNADKARNDVTKIADKILATVNVPYTLDGHEVNTSASVGIAIFPNHATSLAGLVKAADSAMYVAKSQGKNNFQFHNADQSKKAQHQRNLENQLYSALKDDEFKLYYQPLIDIKTKKLVGAEALIRWNHPERGLIQPYEFIELAEQNGQIKSIGKWVLHEACRQLKTWHDLGYTDLKVAVNVSPYQLQMNNMADIVSECLLVNNIPPSSLEIEITEYSLLQDIEKVIRLLNKLSQLGVRISIDDFGTGYSSLSYLKNLPINTLKIDKSFINALNDDHENRAIISTIINLGHELNLTIIAEGVEHEEDIEILHSLGCDLVQGYYFSYPVTQDAFLSFTQQNLN